MVNASEPTSAAFLITGLEQCVRCSAQQNFASWQWLLSSLQLSFALPLAFGAFFMALKVFEKCEAFWAQLFQYEVPLCPLALLGHFRFQGGSRSGTSEIFFPSSRSPDFLQKPLLARPNRVGRCQPSRGRSLMGLRLPHPRPGVAARPQPGLAMGRLSLVLGTSKDLGRKSQASWAVRKLREQGLGLAKSA